MGGKVKQAEKKERRISQHVVQSYVPACVGWRMYVASWFQGLALALASTIVTAVSNIENMQYR